MGNRWKKGMGSTLETLMTESSTCQANDNETWLRLKHGFLMQDYKQLKREIETKKKKLVTKTKRKLQLLAETRFLREKLNSFLENPSEARKVKLKIRFTDEKLPSPQLPIMAEFANLREGFHSDIQIERESKVAGTPPTIDLNHTFLEHDGEEPIEWNMISDALFGKGNAEISAKDSKLLNCRHAKNDTNRVKWRNPVVSMVHHFS